MYFYLSSVLFLLKSKKAFTFVVNVIGDDLYVPIHCHALFNPKRTC